MHVDKNDDNLDDDLERFWPRSMTETQSAELEGFDGKVSNGTAFGYKRDVKDSLRSVGGYRWMNVFFLAQFKSS